MLQNKASEVSAVLNFWAKHFLQPIISPVRLCADTLCCLWWQTPQTASIKDQSCHNMRSVCCILLWWQIIFIVADIHRASSAVCAHLHCSTSMSSYLFLSHTHTHSKAHTLTGTQLNLAEPFLFGKADTKSNLWNWQGPIAVCLVSSDQVSRERRRGNKTVRISAIPTVIFITTTWVERKRERFTKYRERVLSLQEGLSN